MNSRFQEFYLDEYRIIPLAAEIVGHSGKVHVQPKSMEVLLCLASRGDRLVSRQELLAKVWGSTEVSSDLLTRCISELRHALDDNSDRPRFIQTVPRRGYRLVAEVREIDHALVKSENSEQQSLADKKPIGIWENLSRRHVFRVLVAYALVAWLLLQIASTTFEALQLPVWSMTLLTILLGLGFPVALVLGWAYELTPEGVRRDHPMEQSAQSRSQHYFDIIIIGVLAVAVGILGYRVFLMEKDAGATQPVPVETADYPARQTPQNSLAVLRFRNIGGIAEARHFSDGLGEQLLTFLSRMKELRVAARTSTWPLSEREDLDVPEICKLLKVGHILEGSVQKSQDKIRVWSQLVDSNGFHLWSETYDRELTADNIFNIQDQIASEVARHLKIALSDESQQKFGNRPTLDLDALDFNLRGQEYLRGVHSEASLDSAVQLFQQAIDEDARYASAYGGLCQAHLFYYELDSSATRFEAAERSCHRALTLDVSFEDVYRALGELYRRSGQYEKAEQDFRKTLELNPNDGDALYGLARTVEAMDNIELAEVLFKQAIEKQPGYWLRFNTYGTFLWRYGRRAEALEQYKIVTELVPDQPVGYVNMATIYNPMGEFEKALELYQHSLKLRKTRAAYTNIGLTYYRLGRYKEAIAMQSRAIEMAPEDHRAWGRLANAARFAGTPDIAREHYLKARELALSALEINPDSADTHAYLGFYQVQLDENEAALEAVQQAIELAPRAHSVYYTAAQIHTSVGNLSKALDMLTLSVELGTSRHFIAADPDFAALSELDRFKSLLPPGEASTSM